VLVSIDVDAATDVVARIRAKVDYIDEQRSDVAEAGRQGLCSVSVLPQLGEHLNAILGLARDLETRIELAVLVNTGGTSVSTDGGPGGAGAKLSYEVTDDTITAVRGAIGAQIAQRMRDLDPDGGDSPGDDVQELEELTTLLQRYGDDPQVMSGLFAELGPQGVVDVPSQLRRLADSCQQAGTFLFEADGSAAQDPQARFEHLAGLQQRFMEAFGGGLGVATRSEAFGDANPDFAAGLVDQATGSPDWGGWGLSQVLRFGDYDPGFLVEVANGLYGWEKDSQDESWTSRPGFGVVDWRLGTDDQGQYYDPFVGLFQAMGRSPVAAVEFFNPADGAGRAEGEEVADRVGYFVDDRDTSVDDLASLAGALDAAAGYFHRTSVSADDQARSAWVASAAVHAFAERGGTTDGAADAMARLLGRYIVDVDRVANGNKDGEVGVFGLTPSPWHVGLPVGAGMSSADVRAVLGGVLADEDAAGVLGAKAARWNAYRLDWAADHSTTDDPQGLRTAVENGARLNGFLLGVAEADLEAKASQSDAGVKSLLSVLGALRGLVGTNPATGVTLGVVVGQAQTAATDAWATSAEDLAAENLTIRDTAAADYMIGVVQVLDAHDLIDPEALRWADGSVPSFTTPDGVNDHAVDSPQMRRDLLLWLHEEPSEGLPRDMRDEADKGYGDGDAWARRDE